METIFQISTFVFAAGWWINGIFLGWQLLKVLRTKDASGISIITFTAFAILNANATLYGYFTGNLWWLPGTSFATASCVFIVVEAYRRRLDTRKPL